MYIAGIGVIFTRGRGVICLEEALRQGWMPPSPRKTDFLPENFAVYAVRDEDLTEKAISGKMRRADRFSKMAVLAARDALEDARIIIGENRESVGIIAATAFGPHTTTFRFLDDILEYGDANVSPTIFSHSVHNAAAAYIASTLNIRGPGLTLTGFSFPFQQALILARSWLDEGRCAHVLVGGVDECGPVMEYICSRKLRLAEDGKIKPFHFSPKAVAVPGEGSLFLLITAGECRNRYCRIERISLFNNTKENKPDFYILDADGMTGDEREYGSGLAPNACLSAYAPIFGSMLTGSSFHCAIAALMLKEQTRYACPVGDNPSRLNVCATTERTEIKKIQCLGYNCEHKKAIIELERAKRG